MRIKTSDKKGFFSLFKKLVIWQKAAVIISAVAIVGGVSTTVYALAMDKPNEPIVPVINSSDLSSTEPSVVVTSSEAQSSEVPSSEATSSETSSVESPKESSKVSSKESSNAGSKLSSKETDKTSSVANTSSKVISSTPPVKVADMPEGYQERFAPYYKANKDIAGWINLPGTKLDYPVAQGDNDSYYLDRNIYKEISGWGVPYMSCAVTSKKDYQSTNIILYGHSDDKRGLQLSAIKGFRKIDFYKQHPTIDFDTVYADGTYKIAAFFIENTKPGTSFFRYHTFIESTGDEAFNNFIANAKSRSYINTTVDVVPTDKLLTISTCEDTNPNNYNRLVLVARKVRPDEDLSVDTSGATQNTAQVLPK